MKTAPPTRMWSTRLTPELAARLKVASVETGVMQTTIVARLLEHWLSGGKVAGLPKP
jgi:predicted DNA-binding protein